MTKSEQYGELFTFSKDAQLWNDLYERPTRLVHHNMALRRNRALEYAKSHVDLSARVLDLGCGAGVLLESLLDAGYQHLTGVELSTDMVKLARERLSRFGQDRYRLFNAGCESMPCEDAEFDALLCMGVFGYIDDVDGALREVRRVLRPGGVFFMSVRNRTNAVLSDPYRVARWAARSGWRFAKRRVLQRGAEADRFRIDIQDSPRNIIRGVTARGFRLESFEGFGFGPPSVFEKQLLPLRLNIKVSDSLNRLFDKLHMASISRWIGDVSMYAFRKI